MNSLEKYDYAYYPVNPDFDISSKTINTYLNIEQHSVGYFFGEVQVYDQLDCFGEVQILVGQELYSYLIGGTYTDTVLYGTTIVSEESILDGVLEII